MAPHPPLAPAAGPTTVGPPAAPTPDPTDVARLVTEIERWLERAAPPSGDTPPGPGPRTAPAAPGWDVAGLVRLGLAELTELERLRERARRAARPRGAARLAGALGRRPRRARTASAQLRAAAALLASGGWCRGVLTDERRHHCVLGALFEAPADPDCVTRAVVHLRAELTALGAVRSGRGPGGPRAEVASWNNSPATTEGAVLDLLERAARRAEAAGD
ncbi:DUF6197 family protein [Allostreptomyces psammosilenae]|uniref:Uncharacterized protein n=1 Tax=Allostreptomyces psammosilenae TaxID=1892865 RepID=A0A852ZVP7_9ACTN|nr:hypothetical protein [Allostreptomyces psammosilenae]NYI04854.1 hypothetical protein [Allostreptomyces psammosilenae]